MNIPTIALAGNPNSGKTTLFNALTGLNYKVANYPGVTVEKKEAIIALPNGRAVNLVDLPGIYSLSGLSLDEKIATSEILKSHPDILIHVCDSTNLERNFFLLSQLLDCGMKVIVALTMGDLAKRQGIRIHKELLSRTLGAPVVDISVRENLGLQELLETVEHSLSSEKLPNGYLWAADCGDYLAQITTLGEELARLSAPLRAFPPRIVGSLFVQRAWPDTLPTSPEFAEALRQCEAALLEKGIDPQSYETSARYRSIGELVRSSTTVQLGENPIQRRTRQIDNFLTHRVWGTLSFLLVMSLLFQSIFVLAQYPMGLLEGLIDQLGKYANHILPPGQLQSLIVNGVIAGVGSVIIFVPQIAILVFLLALLEDSGYLSRAALVMDRVLRPVGLQGRSFIPLLSSFACAIPGIMSTRTIPTFGDRIATILIAPLMSCSARLPVYTVLIGAFVPDRSFLGFFSLQGTVLLGMYLLGIIGAATVSAVLRRTVLRGNPALFVMEMPPYRSPIARNVLRQVLEALSSFLRSAGTIILAVTILLWFLASYPRGEAQPQLEETYAGKFGRIIEPVIQPLGYNWEIGVSILASFAAREVFVSSLSTVYNLSDSGDDPKGLMAHLREKKDRGEFSGATAASLLVFYVFACMCTSTLAICRRETNSWSWTAFMFFYMTGIAYVAALITYQVGISV